MTLLADHPVRMARARLSLQGLSVGDGFGERFFISPAMAVSLIEARAEPRRPWKWTDDTAMALSIVEVLDRHGGIDEDALAVAFARRYSADPHRGYGAGAHQLLCAIAGGGAWRELSPALFDGSGSMGNGGAMRAGPVGGYFADDLDAVVEHARRSAAPTHAHAEGEAGAIAVAVAAAVAWQQGQTGKHDARALLALTHAHTPDGETRDGIELAMTHGPGMDPAEVAERLGSGQRVLAQDTVPFTLWCAAHHLGDFEAAMWATVAGLGDRDTTCAIVGAIVALGGARVPPAWVAAREPLPC